MTVTWDEISIDEIKSPARYSLAMGPFGSNIKTDNFVPEGVPVIRGGNLSGDRFKDFDFVFLTEEKADELKSANAFSGDLVFTHRGTLGQVGIIPKNAKYPRYVVSQSQMKLSCDTAKVDPLFVYYFFRSTKGQHELLSSTSTTGVPAISSPLSTLRNIRIPYPPLPIQHRIANILGSLDDKIELNRQMNKTLEAMARALFQSWFVDFDPVRVKAEGRQPEGMDAATAALFPSGFEEVNGQEVPAGWDASTIGESVSVQGGSTPSTTNPEFWDDGTVNFATPKDLASLSSPILLSTEKKITSKGVEQISSRILPVGTVLFSSRAPIGYIALTTIPVAINQGFIAITCDKKIPNYFVINWLELNLQAIIDRANGTTFLEISKSNFKPMIVISPSEEVLKKFTQIVAPIYQKIISNEIESRKLIHFRDSLLPKLMSGELPVQGDE